VCLRGLVRPTAGAARLALGPPRPGPPSPSAPCPVAISPAFLPPAGTVYLRLDPSSTSSMSGLWALDGASGAVLFSYAFPTGAANPLSPPIIAGGGVVVTAGPRLMKLFDTGAAVTPAASTT